MNTLFNRMFDLLGMIGHSSYTVTDKLRVIETQIPVPNLSIRVRFTILETNTKPCHAIGSEA